MLVYAMLGYMMYYVRQFSIFEMLHAPPIRSLMPNLTYLPAPGRCSCFAQQPHSASLKPLA